MPNLLKIIDIIFSGARAFQKFKCATGMFIDIPSNIINLAVKNDPAIFLMIMHSYLTTGVNILMALRFTHTYTSSFLLLVLSVPHISFVDGVSDIFRYDFFNFGRYSCFSLQLTNGIRVSIMLTQLRQKLMIILVNFIGIVVLTLIVIFFLSILGTFMFYDYT